MQSFRLRIHFRNHSVLNSGIYKYLQLYKLGKSLKKAKCKRLFFSCLVKLSGSDFHYRYNPILFLYFVTVVVVGV